MVRLNKLDYKCKVVINNGDRRDNPSCEVTKGLLKDSKDVSIFKNSRWNVAVNSP